MKEKEKLILMYRDFEVLSFEVDYDNCRVTILKKLDRFDKAPYGIEKSDHPDMSLLRFFNSRAIAAQRCDIARILKATGAKDEFELSFRGHGLSLSNHYWFKRENENLKYDDINFFSNGWDDTFGRAILNGDYEVLKTCDLNVPDIVTPGWGVKAWIYDNGPKLYKLGIDNDHPEEAICEVLASRLANRIFENGEVLRYELKMINGKYASVSPCMITKDEELVPLSFVLPSEWYSFYRNKNIDKQSGKVFLEKLKTCDMPELYQLFVKIYCFRTIGFISDLHFGNISMIRDMKTNKLRLAPLYDLGGAFGSSKTGKDIISKANKGTMLMIYFLFSGLDPNWDYSWYNPDKLIGFEDEIKEYLSKSEFYTLEIIKCVIDVYHQQKKELDDMKKGSKWYVLPFKR